jgi:hypothetical protein
MYDFALAASNDSTKPFVVVLGPVNIYYKLKRALVAL